MCTTDIIYVDTLMDLAYKVTGYIKLHGVIVLVKFYQFEAKLRVGMCWYNEMIKLVKSDRDKKESCQSY